jgi:hypothetical protein
MRGETDKAKLRRFMVALGERVGGAGTIYLTGGATAVLYNWREATIDVDPGSFRAAVIEFCDEYERGSRP